MSGLDSRSGPDAAASMDAGRLLGQFALKVFGLSLCASAFALWLFFSPEAESGLSRLILSLILLIAGMCCVKLRSVWAQKSDPD